MHVTIHRNDLLAGINAVRSSAPSRTTIPILECMKLAADADRLTIEATDLERHAAVTRPATVTAPGATAVPSDVLTQIAKALPERDVDMRIDPERQRLTISAGRSRYQVAGLAAGDFPAMPDDNWRTRFEIDCGALRRLIGETAYATSTDTARYYLAGARFDSVTVAGTSMLRASASDGHRAIIIKVPLPADAQDMPRIIVPRDAQSEFGKLLDADGSATVAISHSRIRIARGETVIVSKLVEAEYPDIDRIVPQANAPTQVAIDRKSFEIAIRRAMAVSDGTSILLQTKAGEMHLSGRRANSDGTDVIECEPEGPGLESGINPQYLIEQLAAMRGEKVRIEQHGAGQPFRFFDSAAPDDIHIIMPMRW